MSSAQPYDTNFPRNRSVSSCLTIVRPPRARARQVRKTSREQGHEVNTPPRALDALVDDLISPRGDKERKGALYFYTPAQLPSDCKNPVSGDHQASSSRIHFLWRKSISKLRGKKKTIRTRWWWGLAKNDRHIIHERGPTDGWDSAFARCDLNFYAMRSYVIGVDARVSFSRWSEKTRVSLILYWQTPRFSLFFHFLLALRGEFFKRARCFCSSENFGSSLIWENQREN